MAIASNLVPSPTLTLLHHAGTRFMAVEGDTMQPTASPGDTIALQSVHGFADDGLYVLTDFLRTLHLYRVERVDPERLRLSAENPVYPPFDMTLESFDEMVVGKVFGVIKPVAGALRA